MKSRHLVLSAAVTALLLATVAAGASTTIYKWVDDDGVVHYGDNPPSDRPVERVDATPSSVVPAPPLPTERPATAVEPAPPEPPPATNLSAEPDPSTLTQAELDARCDQAREAKIAPLREAEIEKCKQDRRNDPAWCERFNASFGDGGRTIHGTMRPRMFDDLPECVDALRARNQRFE